MSGPSAQQLEGLIEPPPDLDAARLTEWRTMRRLAHRRHARWRASVPAIESLFDDASHRAKALAGNLATELGDVLRGTARIAPEAVVDGTAPAEWLVASCRDWKHALRGGELVQEAGPHAVELFDAMLEQLVDRERDRAIEEARRQVPGGGGQEGRLRRIVQRLLRPVARFFRPA